VRTGWKATSICFGDATSELDGDLEAIRATVMRKTIALKVCYERALDRTSTIEGVTIATFRVLGDGSVSGSQANGVQAKVDACVAREIATFTFATPVKGAPVSVTIPITFRPPNR
jgi:hypothetical protein